MGTVLFVIGTFSALYIGVMKLLSLRRGVSKILVTDNPFFYISLTCIIIGTMLFLAGFLGELISRNSPNRNRYQVEERV
jgi:arginine exporter protein ArgO